MSMSKKMITLKASDGGLFEIDEAAALQSQTLAHLIEDDCVENGVPLANVTSKILEKVIEYCKKHVGDDDGGDDSLSKEKKDELKNWDAEFMNNMDQSTIFDLILAASYLNMRSLLDLTCQTVADMISSCKSGAEIRDMFDIENDFTPEEEEEIRRENQWAFE